MKTKKAKKINKVKKPIPVMVAIPNQGNINIRLAMQLIDIITESMVNREYTVDLRFSSVTCIDYNRNTIVQLFLETNCEYLLMMDCDNPCLKNPLDLIKLKKDIIGYPTFIFKVKELGDPEMNYNVYKKEKVNRTLYWHAQKMTNGKLLMEYDAVGTGCILIKRKVLETLKAPFLSKLYKDKGVRKYGMDLWFCERAKKAGFKVWAHWGYACHHLKTIDLLQVARLMLREKFDITMHLKKIKERK